MFSLFSQVRFLTSCKQLEKNSEETHLINYAEPVLLFPLKKQLNNLGGRNKSLPWIAGLSNTSGVTDNIYANVEVAMDETEFSQRLSQLQKAPSH